MKTLCFQYSALRVCGLLALMAMACVLMERGANAQAMRFTEAVAVKPITLDLSNVPMTETLTACCKQAGCRYRISAAIQGFVARERRTLHFQAVPFKKVWEAILGEGRVFHHSYSYRKVGDVFLIEGPKVYADAKQTTPAEILASILEELGVNYMFPSDALPTTPMDFVVSDIPLEQALKQFLKRLKSPQPLQYVTTSGIFVFFNDLTGQKPPIIPPGVDPREYAREGHIAVKLKDVERLDALHALFQVYQEGYSINVPLKGTMSVEKNVAFHTLLMEILRGGDPLYTYMVENGVYTIMSKHRGE